ncbi:uncharacterized protein [Spinacia oleracea]|uniref:Uncharacterized protein n=1 Tax=Spinacia oleracea TaxID=3562 RepID=A0ABM3QP16_SPIOL|nr:uncharacterized protein LOC110790319 [Spinacia oleracea]
MSLISNPTKKSLISMVLLLRCLIYPVLFLGLWFQIVNKSQKIEVHSRNSSNPNNLSLTQELRVISVSPQMSVAAVGMTNVVAVAVVKGVMVSWRQGRKYSIWAYTKPYSPMAETHW